MQEARTLWGQRIRAARRAIGMSQVQLAAAMRVSQQQVSQWESGNFMPRERRRPLLAAILGTTVDALFAWPEPNGDEAAA